MKNIYKTLSITTILLGSLHGLTLQDTVKETLSTSAKISSNNLNTKSKLYEIEAQKAGYYPTLDLNAYLEKSQTKDNRDSTGQEAWVKKDGHRSTLSAQQLLYDGSNTSSKVAEAEHDYASSRFDTIEKNELVILDSVKAYMALLTEQEKQYVTDYSIEAHEEALNIAYDQEDISGEILETKRTISYIELEKDKNFNKKQIHSESLSNFVNVTSFKPIDELCVPKIDITLIPTTLEDSISYALENSNKYKKQQALVQRQRARMGQLKAGYKPTVKARLDGSYDDDLELQEDGSQKELNGKIDLNWNLYRGGRDKALIEKEKVSLLEQNKLLEQIKRDVVQSTTDAYNKFHTSQNRVDNLNKSIKTNGEILDINRQQLEDGTKTFIDVLDAQNKVSNTQENLIQQENNHIENYYVLINEFSILTKAILKDYGNECQKIDIPNLIKNKTKKDEGLDGLLDDGALGDDNATLPEDDNATLPEDELTLSGGAIDGLDLTGMTLNIDNSKFGLKKKIRDEQFKEQLETISDKLINILENDFDNIKQVEMLSYASSEYRSKKTLEDKAKANIKLTSKRLMLLKEHIIKKAKVSDLDLGQLESKLVEKPMGATDFILNDDGTENKEASRRIVIKIIK